MDINNFIETIGAFKVNLESSNGCGYGSAIHENYGYGNDDGNGYFLTNHYGGSCGHGNGNGKGYGKVTYNAYHGEGRFNRLNHYGQYK